MTIDLELDIQVTTDSNEQGTYRGTGTVATCATDSTCNDEKSC